MRSRRRLVHLKRREIERKLREALLVVFLRGAGGHGVEERRLIKRALEKEGILAIIAEDDLPRDVAPSLAEKYVLENREVELAFINVESWGSVAEFAQYRENKLVASKLRVLVGDKHHPLYGESRSYLTDLYLTHLAVYGHVYAYGKDGCRSMFPRPVKLVMKLAKRYKELKALGKEYFTR